MIVTYAEALATARHQIPPAEARLLLAEASGESPTWLVAHDEDVMPGDVAARFDAWVARRAGGEPVAYILGWREFYGRRFTVSPGVLIPRPETELLVEQGLAAVAATPSPRILDLGTGSGCIAISLALERPDAEVWAADLSVEALNVAMANASALGARLNFVQSDWTRALPVKEFDLIVSNPPYIAPDDAHLSQGDLRYEPRTALAAAEAGLSDLKKIAAAAPGMLKAGGWLLCEHGWDQAAAMLQIIENNRFKSVQYRDLAGIVRVSGGQLRA